MVRCESIDKSLLAVEEKINTDGSKYKTYTKPGFARWSSF